jgi:glycosyltransferase involved in cell wall biosynthesis
VIKQVAILIPCYNEEATIRKVVEDFLRAFSAGEVGGIPVQTTVYVYDNNSSDKTAELAKAAGAVVVKEKRQGKGNVVRSQFRDIDADAYIMVDGDDTYEATNAPAMVELVLRDNVDMVIGDRLSGEYFKENQRRFHGGGNVVVRKLINMLFSADVNDIMTGYRAFSRGFVKTFPVLSQGFEIETEMTIHALDKKMRLEEITVDYRDRPDGSESKLNTVSDGIKVIRKIGGLVSEFRPMRFYGVLAFILLVVGVVAGTVPVLEFFETHKVTHFPTLFGSGILIVSGILLWVTGIILNLIAKKHRQLFEVNLNIIQSSHSLHKGGSDE